MKRRLLYPVGTALTLIVVLMMLNREPEPGTISPLVIQIQNHPGSDQIPSIEPALTDLAPEEMETQELPSAESLLTQLKDLQALPESPDRKNRTAEILCKLAVAQGDLAIEALFAVEDEAFQRQLFGYVLSGWADSDPLVALQWFHDPAHDGLAADGYAAPPDFYQKCFRKLAIDDPQSAAASLPALEDPANRLRAISSMLGVSRERGALPAMLDALGSKAEMRPVEMALVNKLVGDEIGYEEWRAKVLDAAESKLLAKEVGLDTQSPSE